MAIPLEDEIFYPESDGEPMAETEVHLEEIVYVWEALKTRFEAEADVFVGADMFLYYREGDPRAVVAPDGFVVKGVPKLLPGNRRRRKYLLWEEGRVPCFILEATSESTRSQDEKKKETYERLGVDEYFQFDPLGEYLRPTLQGYHLAGGRYRPIPPNADGSLLSRSTGVVFRVEGARLRLTDAVTGEPLLRNEEEREARRHAEKKAAVEAEARRQADAARRQADAARRQADAARRQAEAARRQAEEKAAVEAEARRQAEEKAAIEVEARRQADAARRQAEEKLRDLEEKLKRLGRS